MKPLTRAEQIQAEREIITELRARLEIWETLLREAEECEQEGLDAAIDKAHARLGLNSTQKQLNAHEASLKTIEGRIP